MREILFRGKRVDNGEWIYGWYFQKQNPHTVDGQPITHCVSDLPPFGAEVILETVGQYSGRKAEEEIKIFEGDKCILTTFDYNGHDTQYECTVEWIDGALVFVDEKNDVIWSMYQIEDAESDVKVIGNIHDKEANK